MTPSNKDLKKSSKKILETNIALKIKEALKDFSHIDSKQVTKIIGDASQKIAKRLVKASKETEGVSGQKATSSTAIKPKVSKVKATRVVAKIKEVIDSATPDEKGGIKVAVLPAISKGKKTTAKPAMKVANDAKKAETIKKVASPKKTPSESDLKSKPAPKSKS